MTGPRLVPPTGQSAAISKICESNPHARKTDEGGATAIEYGLIATGIAVAIIR